MAAAFAMAYDMTFKSIINRIGHDGSEILWPELGEPRQRKTFHLQEFIILGLELGKRPICLEFETVAYADDNHQYTLDHNLIVKSLMFGQPGVLLGEGVKIR